MIVSDNGTQFAFQFVAEFCSPLKIQSSFTSVEHPQSNYQAELEEAKGRWVEVLLQVLWSYHTTPHSITNETSFCLTFDIKEMISIEIGEPSPQTTWFQHAQNEDELPVNLEEAIQRPPPSHVQNLVRGGPKTPRQHPRPYERRSKDPQGNIQDLARGGPKTPSKVQNPMRGSPKTSPPRQHPKPCERQSKDPPKAMSKTLPWERRSKDPFPGNIQGPKKSNLETLEPTQCRLLNA
ncbi:hypothetical protein CR513_18410, partial [Mucuna pruriens]